MMLSLWAGPVQAQAETFYADQFSVSGAGWPSFVDNFNTGNPPPSGPLDAALGGSTYTVVGSFPAGSEALGKLAMSPASNGVPSFNGGLAVAAAVDKTLAGASPFSISGVFDVPVATNDWLMGVVAFEYALVGTTPVYTGNIIYSLIGSAGGQYFEAAATANSLLDTFTLLSVTPIAAPTSSQVELGLSSTTAGLINASFQTYSTGTPVGSASQFYTYLGVTPLYEPGFTVGFTSAVPEPAEGGLLLVGAGAIGLMLRWRPARRAVRG
jgi:hypothetical protein